MFLLIEIKKMKTNLDAIPIRAGVGGGTNYDSSDSSVSSDDHQQLDETNNPTTAMMSLNMSSSSSSNLLAVAAAHSLTSNNNGGNYQEENVILQQEINKLEDLLANARAERDEILIRYTALSERVINLILIIIRAFYSPVYQRDYKKFDIKSHLINK